MPYIKQFRVRGNCSFPLDMLRYDNCVPRNEDDKASTRLSLREAGREGYTLVREIELLKIANNRRMCNSVTLDRWHSFGWQVVREDKSEFLTKQAAESYSFDTKQGRFRPDV